MLGPEPATAIGALGLSADQGGLEHRQTVVAVSIQLRVDNPTDQGLTAPAARRRSTRLGHGIDGAPTCTHTPPNLPVRHSLTVANNHR